MEPVASAALWMADRLFTGSLQGALVIVLVWAACRAIPRMPAAVQAALWWLASVKLVLALLPLPLLPVPVLPPPDALPAAAALTGAHRTPSTVAPAPEPTVPDTMVRPLEWRTPLVGVWLLAVGLQACRLVRERRALGALVRRSGPGSAEDTALVLRIACDIALRPVPRVRQSADITGLQVAGVLRPTVLVSADGPTLTEREKAMALCHELMHVRRHDLVLAWVPAIAERLFFFHPLARVMGREYLAAREAACDAAVIRALEVSPKEYGRLLVRLGVGGPAPAFAASGSSSSTSTLRRRLTMLQHASSAGVGTRRLAWCLGALVLLALMPFQLVARTPAQSPLPPRPVIARPAAPAAPAVPVVPATPELPAVQAALAAQPADPFPVAPAVPVIRVPTPPRPVLPAASPRELASLVMAQAEAARVQQQIEADLERLARELAARSAEPQAEDHREQMRAIQEQAAAVEAMLKQHAERMAALTLAARQDLAAADALRSESDALRAARADPALAEQLEQFVREQRRLVEQQRQELARRDETIAVMREMLERMRVEMSEQVQQMRTALEQALAAMRAEAQRNLRRD